MKDNECLPWFPWFVNDFMGSLSVQCMNATQIGGYFMLLQWQWQSGAKQSIPNDPVALSQLSKMGDDWGKLGAAVLSQFSETKCGTKIFNEKLKSIYKDQAKRHAKRKKAGKSGAKTRWGTPDESDSNANGNANGNANADGNGNQNQNQNHSSYPKPEPKNPPKSPTGGKGRKRLTEAEKKRSKVEVNTPDMEQIGTWFKRRPGTLWSVAEAEALADIQCAPDEVGAIERYYKAAIPKEQDYRRRDLLTMLNNWQGELDRARRWESENGRTATHVDTRRNKI